MIMFGSETLLMSAFDVKLSSRSTNRGDLLGPIEESDLELSF